MALNCEEEIVKLTETCAGIKFEMTGFGNLMKELAKNQATLIELAGAIKFLGENQTKTDKALGECFGQVRCLKELRANERLKNLESAQKWSRRTFIAATISITTGTVIAFFKFFFNKPPGGP